MKDEYVNDIRENGYCIIEDYYSNSEIESILSEIDAVMSQVAIMKHMKNIDEKYFFLKKHHPVLKSRCYDMFSYTTSLNRFINKQVVTDIAQSLYKSPVLINNVQIRVDDSSLDRDLPLHQELNQMSLFNLTVWVPLVDVLEKSSGGIQVIPKSHKAGLLKHTMVNNYSAVDNDELLKLEEPKRVQVKKGDAILFHPYLVHGSLPNKSGNIRWTSIARFNELSHINYLKDKSANLTCGYDVYHTMSEFRQSIYPIRP